MDANLPLLLTGVAKAFPCRSLALPVWFYLGEIMTISEYLKAHERLLLALVAAGVLWVGIGKVDTLIQHHDDANLKQAQVIAAQDASKNAAITAQVASDKAAFDALQTKLQAEDAALVQANVALATALTTQQKTDAILPPTDLVARWNSLVPQAAASVTPNGVTLPSAGAVATVQQLELIPVQQQELTNEQTLVANGNALAAAQTKQVTDLTAQVTGLKLQSVDDAKVCQAQIAVVKADARKSKRRWFVAGFAAGIATRILGEF